MRIVPTALGLVLSAGLCQAQRNVLVIVVDDIGVDRIGAYQEHPDPGRTPNIDLLAASGVLFRNFYANPVCTPTRAALLTGRYGFRTGVGANGTELGTGPALDPAEVILPEILAGYFDAAVGKWHLGHDDAHPNLTGFSYFAGTLRNLDRMATGASYWLWTKLVNGSSSVSTNYATTETADDTISAIQTLPTPWFVYSCFHAGHEPVHAPPSNLHTYSLVGDPLADVPLFTRAMIEALDTEIGRVLASLPSDTVVFFVGDNGTWDDATDPPTPPGRSKGTVWEGGIRVPLIVSGTGVATGECGALVNVTDLYATIAEIAGVPSTAEDSVSLGPYLVDPAAPPAREWVFSERFSNNQSLRAIRGPRYKLMRVWHGGATTERLFDLLQDPTEQQDLLLGQLTQEQSEALANLRCTMPAEAAHTVVCAGELNSTGAAGTLVPTGSERVALDLFCVHAGSLPPSEFGYLLASQVQGFVPNPAGSAGNLCMGIPLARFVTQLGSSGAVGAFSIDVDLGQVPSSPVQAVMPGDQWTFQVWYRDGMGSNFTEALSVTFE